MSKNFASKLENVVKDGDKMADGKSINRGNHQLGRYNNYKIICSFTKIHIGITTTHLGYYIHNLNSKSISLLRCIFILTLCIAKHLTLNCTGKIARVTLQKRFRNAVRQTITKGATTALEIKEGTAAMRKAIWATLYHSLIIDEGTRNTFCPVDSWCLYKYVNFKDTHNFLKFLKVNCGTMIHTLIYYIIIQLYLSQDR